MLLKVNLRFANHEVNFYSRINIAHIVSRQILAWNKALRVNPGNSLSSKLVNFVVNTNSCMEQSILKSNFSAF